MQPRRAGTRSIRKAIYKLKRAYGFPIVISRVVDTQADLETGRKRETFRFVNVRRAVILPNKSVWDSISPATMHTKRGLYDANTRFILIDRQDVGEFGAAIDDMISYDGLSYLVSEVRDYELKTAYVIKTQAVRGSEVLNPGNQVIEDTLSFTQEAGGVVV